MIDASVERRSSFAVWALVVCSGSAALIARQTVPSVAAHILLYVILVGVCLAMSSRDQAAAPIAPSIALSIGIAALLATRLFPGTVLPLRGGAVLVTLGLLAAVAEEAFFRQFVYSRVAQRSVPLAVVASAVLFGLLHLPSYGWAAFPLDLGAGFLLSWQRWASGRWEVPAATHAAANLLAMIR